MLPKKPEQDAAENRFHAILGAEPSGEGQGPLTGAFSEVGGDLFNRSRLEIAFRIARSAGRPWQQAGRGHTSLQTTRKLIGGMKGLSSAHAEALLTAYRTGTSPALTKGRPGGKLPSGNRADRSPAFRCSAASRNAATKRAYIL